jgi:hypothetical protein
MPASILPAVLRTLTRGVFGVALRVFFRRVEIVGEEQGAARRGR